MPSSSSESEPPPGETPTLRLPFGTAQLMLSIDTVNESPSATMRSSRLMGRRRPLRTELLQVSALWAFKRLSVTVDAVAGLKSDPASKKLRSARQSRLGSCALSRTRAPTTCGVAMDVPLKVS